METFLTSNDRLSVYFLQRYYLPNCENMCIKWDANKYNFDLISYYEIKTVVKNAFSNRALAVQISGLRLNCDLCMWLAMLREYDDSAFIYFIIFVLYFYMKYSFDYISLCFQFIIYDCMS